MHIAGSCIHVRRRFIELKKIFSRSFQRKQNFFFLPFDYDEWKFILRKISTVKTVFHSQLNLPLIARGKVRDIYNVSEDKLLLVASDRLSAFDVVFSDPIPEKGAVLTQLSKFWFGKTSHIIENHLISADSSQIEEVANDDIMKNRCMLVAKSKPFPVECVVRGYLEGSAWNDYLESGSVCGVQLPAGLKRRQKLDTPIFTPSTKAEEGHDMPISFEEVVKLIGEKDAVILHDTSIALYNFAHDLLLEKEIVLSDTKFEFGKKDGKILLIDEAITPDSSRFWEKESYTENGAARSMDKQFVRDYVESIGWEKKPPSPKLPEDVINGMTERYKEIYRKITDTPLL